MSKLNFEGEGGLRKAPGESAGGGGLREAPAEKSAGGGGRGGCAKHENPQNKKLFSDSTHFHIFPKEMTIK